MTIGHERASLVRTSDTRWQLLLLRGAGFRNVVLPGSLRVNFKAGRLVQPGGSRVTRRAVKTGKSLQWIERQKRSPSPN